MKFGYDNDPSFKEFSSRDLSTACRRWFNSTATEGLVKVVYGCSFQSLWLQQPQSSHLLKAPCSDESSWELRQRENIRVRYFQVSTTFSRGASRNFLLKGGGAVQTLVQKGPPPPLSSHRPRLHVTIFWPLTVYGCTRKGYTLGTASSVSAGCRWRWNYCFASRGRQIRGEYPKTIAFFNIPGILSSGKMQRAFR